MSKKVLDGSKLVTKQEIVNWFISELAMNTSTAVSVYVMKEDTIFINHMADLLIAKISQIIDKNFREVLQIMNDTTNETNGTDAEHDLWAVGMKLENDISSFKHFKVKGLDRVINSVLDTQAKKRRGTIIKMEVKRVSSL